MSEITEKISYLEDRIMTLEDLNYLRFITADGDSGELNLGEIITDLRYYMRAEINQLKGQLS